MRINAFIFSLDVYKTKPGAALTQPQINVYQCLYYRTISFEAHNPLTLECGCCCCCCFTIVPQWEIFNACPKWLSGSLLLCSLFPIFFLCLCICIYLSIIFIEYDSTFRVFPIYTITSWIVFQCTWKWCSLICHPLFDCKKSGFL